MRFCLYCGEVSTLNEKQTGRPICGACASGTGIAFYCQRCGKEIRTSLVIELEGWYYHLECRPKGEGKDA